MEKTVTVIPQLPKLPKRERVAAYARVSTGKDAMLHSLAAQVDYYAKLIRSNSMWDYAGVYADNAQTGTKENRPEFQRLLADCRAGRIDRILVKSISRFARNTVTLLETVRELRAFGIDIFFEEQNLHTLSGDGELMLTILASFAEAESKSVSDNCLWRIQKKMEKGECGVFNIYGYRFHDGHLVVEPDEAAVVKRIFQMYQDGMGTASIANTLNEEGIPPLRGGIWRKITVATILRDEKYTGNMLLQKSFRADPISKRQVRNNGERRQYLVSDSHEQIITIMSSLSQEESRSISENVSWGIRKSFADGKVPFAYKHFLGYRRGPDGKPEIDPEEAEVVRTIYRRYLEGVSPARIARDLTAAAIRTPSGKSKWAVSTIQSILSNERYKGMAILQKGFTTDFLTKKKKKNEGELPQYKVEGSHPAIIPEETWELVQLEVERRSRLGSRFSSKGPLSSRLVCADCGGFFGSKVWHSTDKNRTVVWRCNNKYKNVSRSSGGTKCVTAHVTEEQVMAVFAHVVEKLLAQRPEVIAACEAVITELLDTTVEDTKLAKAHEEAEVLAQQVKVLIDAQAHGDANTEAHGDSFKEQYSPLEKQYSRLQERIQALEAEKGNKTFRAKEAHAFLMAMEGFGKLSDTELFNALVDRVVVGDGLAFVLRDGTEWKTL